MIHNDFEQYQLYIMNKTNDIKNNNPSLIMGQIIMTLVKQDFPIIIKKILYTKLDIYNKNDDFNDFWNYIKIKIFS